MYGTHHTEQQRHDYQQTKNVGFYSIIETKGTFHIIGLERKKPGKFRHPITHNKPVKPCVQKILYARKTIF